MNEHISDENVNIDIHHCVKSVRIRSYSGPHFPAFGLNTERYVASLRIQAECGKMRTRTTTNAGTFHVAHRPTDLLNLILFLEKAPNSWGKGI